MARTSYRLGGAIVRMSVEIGMVFQQRSFSRNRSTKNIRLRLPGINGLHGRHGIELVEEFRCEGLHLE